MRVFVRSLSIGCFLSLAFLAGFPRIAAAQDYAYGGQAEQRLTVCRPEGAGGRHPAVLMIHGGGWQAGSRMSLQPVCAQFASLGIVAIPVDYRLNTDPPLTAWPMQLADVQAAMRWVRRHAATLGVDPRHICAEGDSAGGQLAELLGVLPATEKGDMGDVSPEVSPHADCVVAISGPADLLIQMQYHRGAMVRLLGTSDPALLRERAIGASPALRVEDAVPTLLIHGTDDQAVPFAEAVEMQRAVSAKGAPAWLIAHPGGHEVKGMSVEEKRGLWPFIAGFVRRERLDVPPGQIAIAQVFGGD